MTPRFLIVPALSGLTLVAFGLTVLFALLLAMPAGRRFLADGLGAHAWWLLGGAWIVSTIATTGSLYLSEGMGLEPCELCWYQRIAMYPLVVVLGVALLRRDAAVWKTAIPLAAVGALVSAYHVGVQWMPALEVMQCTGGTPCSLRYFVTFGFVTIPTMAGSAFLLIVTTVAAHAWLVSRPSQDVAPADLDLPWFPTRSP